MKTFKDLAEAKTPIVFAFGRFNPPTTGHEKLIEKTASVAGSNPYRIYPSFTQNPKRDPLPHALKTAYMRKMFKKYARKIIADKDAKTAIMIAVKLYDEGFRNLVMVAGSDRVKEFDTLLDTYNGVEGKIHGYYKFDSIDVVNAGQRDPDSEGVEGMSASKMRVAAAEGNMGAFLDGVPSGFANGKKLYRDVRKYMGIREEREMGDMNNYEELRDAYLTGKIWNVGDMVEANGVVGEIVRKGTNYLSVVDVNGKVCKAWLHEVTSKSWSSTPPTHDNPLIVVHDAKGRMLMHAKLSSGHSRWKFVEYTKNKKSIIDQIHKAGVGDKKVKVTSGKEGPGHRPEGDNPAGSKLTLGLSQWHEKEVKEINEGVKDLPPHLQKLVKQLDKKEKELEKKGLKVKTFIYNPDTGKPDIELDERNYRNEYDNYHARPEQREKNAARLRARRLMVKNGKVKPFDDMDVHHKDNNPLNNEEENLEVTTKKWNRTEPRLRNEVGKSRPRAGGPKSIEKSIKKHIELTNKYIKQGMNKDEASKKAYKEITKEEVELDEKSKGDYVLVDKDNRVVEKGTEEDLKQIALKSIYANLRVVYDPNAKIGARVREGVELDEVWWDKVIAKLDQMTHPKEYGDMVTAYAKLMKQDKYKKRPNMAADIIAREYSKVSVREFIKYINTLVAKKILPQELKAEYTREEWSFKNFVNQIQERELTDPELKRREEIAKDLSDADFKKRYGARWKEVKMGVATKMAKKESLKT